MLVAHRAAKRASKVQEPEPDGMPQVVIKEARGLPPVSLNRRCGSQNVGSQTIVGGEDFRRIGDGARVPPPPSERGFSPRLFSGPDPRLALRVVAVIVILMNGEH